MEKRIRLQRAAAHTSFIHEMSGDKIINQVFVMSRAEAAQLYLDLGARYGFPDQINNNFPTDLFTETM